MTSAEGALSVAPHPLVTTVATAHGDELEDSSARKIKVDCGNVYDELP